MIDIERCPGTLKPGFQSYSSSTLRNLFHNKKVSHFLPYDSPGVSDEDKFQLMVNQRWNTISGKNDKGSLVLEKNKLRYAQEGESGQYILQTYPRDVEHPGQVPANEHLTMQIARQIFQIPTVEIATIFYKSGKPTSIAGRFDLSDEGSRWGVEDFATLADRSEVTYGPNYKTADISYEDIAYLIEQYVGAYAVEIEKFYKLVLFNFIFSNGNAHLRSFSLKETIDGDYILSPAYGLMNTRIHIADNYFALENGLFSDGSVKIPTGKDFIEFGRRIGISNHRVETLFEQMTSSKEKVYDLIGNSYMNPGAKRGYSTHYNIRIDMLKNG